MQRGSGGGTQRLRRKGTGGAALAGSCRDRASCAESGCGAQNCADVAGILHSGEHNQEWRAYAFAHTEKIVEAGGARLHQRGYALRMLGVRNTFKESIGRAQNRNADFRAVDQRGKSFMMALAGFAEE